jgi:hypothetical protein
MCQLHESQKAVRNKHQYRYFLKAFLGRSRRNFPNFPHSFDARTCSSFKKIKNLTEKERALKFANATRRKFGDRERSGEIGGIHSRTIKGTLG